nr:hypothetical protein [uncultured Chryseobacterium sp.]
MQKIFRFFFVSTLLLVFLYQASGIGVCIEHTQHTRSRSILNKDHHKTKGETKFSPDDSCQCALHLSMNHVLLPEDQSIDFEISTTNNHQLDEPKTFTYRCTLDFFSSRAPPFCFSA